MLTSQITTMSKPENWASLVAQWLGICLPVQGTRVRALVWEDPTCRRATKPVSHNYWACASGACAPQRARQWETRAPRWRVAPARHSWRKSSHRNEDPTQPKINKLKKNKKPRKLTLVPSIELIQILPIIRGLICVCAALCKFVTCVASRNHIPLKFILKSTLLGYKLLNFYFTSIFSTKGKKSSN